MIERGEHARFTLEAREPIEILGEHRRLDRDLAPEFEVARARYTSPMPPASIKPSISYAPNTIGSIA